MNVKYWLSWVSAILLVAVNIILGVLQVSLDLLDIGIESLFKISFWEADMESLLFGLGVQLLELLKLIVWYFILVAFILLLHILLVHSMNRFSWFSWFSFLSLFALEVYLFLISFAILTRIWLLSILWRKLAMFSFNLLTIGSILFLVFSGVKPPLLRIGIFIVRGLISMRLGPLIGFDFSFCLQVL